MFAPEPVDGMPSNPPVKGFELQSSTRNAVGVVPGSTSGSFLAPQLGLNPSTGILSGSVLMPSGKRTGLQGVLLQRTPYSVFTPTGFQNTNGVYGVGIASDGTPFVLTEVMP
jgi:hypothetical protein